MSEMGREAVEALESAARAGGPGSPAVEVGELGPAEPALDVAGGDLGSGGEPGEEGPGGELGHGLAEPGELGPAGLEPGLAPGRDMRLDDSDARWQAEAIHGSAEAASEMPGLEPGAAAGEPGEAGPADPPESSVGWGFQQAGETAEQGIEAAGRDIEAAEQGVGKGVREAISAVEAAGEARTRPQR